MKKFVKVVWPNRWPDQFFTSGYDINEQTQTIVFKGYKTEGDRHVWYGNKTVRLTIFNNLEPVQFAQPGNVDILVEILAS